MRLKTKVPQQVILAAVIFLLALATLMLPMMSVYCAEGESGTMLVRIFNLAEFGIAGCMPIIAPILLFLTMLIRFPQKAKRLIALCVFAANAVCTAISGRNAYIWLAEIGTENVRFHPVCTVYVLLMLTAVLEIYRFADLAAKLPKAQTDSEGEV